MTTGAGSISEVAISEILGEVHVDAVTTLLLEQRPVMLFGSAAYRADMGDDYAGVPIFTVLERTGWAMERVDRNGEIVNNPSRVKLLNEVWPIIRGTIGNVVDIYAGGTFTSEPNAAIIWQGPFPFRIGIDKSVQPLVEYPYLALRFQSVGIKPWSLLGLEMDIIPTGEVYA